MNALDRRIGLLALTLYGVGDILGAGVYGLIGKAAGEMGSAVWLAFLVSLVAAGLSGLSYASLGSRYPKAGGAAYITLRAFGRSELSYMVGLAVLASGLTSMAAASRVFAGYLSPLLPTLPPSLLAPGFALLLAGIVFRGIRESMAVNGLCTVIELTGLAIVILAGLPFIGGTDYLNATTAANPTGDITITLLLGGAVLTFYSFIGFEDMLNVSEEVKNPQRTLPVALLLALGIASMIYMLISIIAVSVIPAHELATSTQPLVDVVARAWPEFPTALYSIIALFAVANTALLNFIMGSRLVFGMARQGLLPRTLSDIHPTRHTPHKAILAILIVYLGLILSGDISSLARATSVLLLGCFIMVNTALIVLKRRETFTGTFEVPTLVPVCGALISASMLSQAKLPELMTATALLAGIAMLYVVLKPSMQPDAQT